VSKASEISLNPQSSIGDILTTDGSSRIAIPLGTARQILTAQSSTSSGLSWVTPPSSFSNYHIIASTTVTTGVQTISFTGISSIVEGIGTSTFPFYISYRFEIAFPAKTAAGNSEEFFIVLNNNSTASGTCSSIYWESYSVASINSGNTRLIPQSGNYNANGVFWSIAYDFPRFSSGPFLNIMGRSATGFSGTSPGYRAEGHLTDSTFNNSNITSVTFDTLSATDLFPVGTTITLYGIKSTRY
jgi:hypothetical protein